MDDINYSAIGQRMQKLRRERNITQEQIANALGVTVAFISNVENNRAKMNLRVLYHYARILDVSIDYILQPGTPEDTSADLTLDREILHILKKYSREDKERLIRILTILKEQPD